ncbi:hypothetical protein DUNSADRAFT_8947 [Dunaliella salina]|uniref:Encoded protein n=1 Tax=Dunaliella salina TaxID=3046 RepID=A0ABQ7GIE7_DUNSA|nr:hypothetical protein DUNSADRAFT_8947 [Dunaliella salina]KAF5834392.1 hypothetical protein DUNSADRAFT_8947 [Dunaliella salina]|eukprot:KAF5834391.1 hypothetical protein DUNSADRAFT_8947 [Dunaliella salina]
MKQFSHPLPDAGHAHIRQREELARCCFGGCKGKQQGRNLGDAWVRVEKQPADEAATAGEARTSSNKRYTSDSAGGTDHGTAGGTSRQHGL